MWRDSTTLQLGLDPEHAVVIGGLDPAAVALVDSLDGSRDLTGVLAGAVRSGLEPGRASALVDLLRRAGVLEDVSADHRVLRSLSRAERERLAPDLAAASLTHDDDAGGLGVLRLRQAAFVAVHGAGRIGAAVVGLLAAAGLGAVTVVDPTPTSLADTAPGGLQADDEGLRRQDAAMRAARRSAPSVRLAPPRGRPLPDVAVVAEGAPPGLPDDLVRQGVPHLFAAMRENTGVIGPFVVPGRSSCQRCHDLHRCDRDRAWPSIRAQLTSSDAAAAVGGTAAGAVRACDVVLAATVAGHVALQILAFIDSGRDPAPVPTVDGTIEIAQGGGRLRRRSWSAHPLCGCDWTAEDPSE